MDAQKIASAKQQFPQLANDALYEILCETKCIELDPQKIAEKIDELTREIEIRLQEKANIVLVIQKEEEVISSITMTIHDLEKVLSSYEAQKNNILEESKKLISELEVVDTELKEAKSALTDLKAKEDGLNKNLETLEQEIQSMHSSIKDRQGMIAAKSQEREEATVLIAQLETEIELTKETEKSHQENLKMFEEAIVADLEEVKKLEDESENNKLKKEEIRLESIAIEQQNVELNAKRESLKDVISGYEREKEQVSVRINKVQEDIRAIQQKIEVIHRDAHKMQMQNQETVFSIKSIKDRLLQTYKINLDELTWEAQAEVTIEQIDNEIEQLRKKCESFGTVNLVAIEEFDELKQRFEFLTKQQADLLTAKESLHDTISKINRTTRQLFLDTFTKVSEEFRIYFRMLFGGGEAQLILVDPENVLESGIEIIARPPGKKLQNITLLSGGEKSLAAIALIFGVFKVRPSPFCILDEIDAALDESNVGRFSYLLKDFSKIAQFIVITHNKRTIANADIMYGITMQETGISKIVSVKFGENKEKEANKQEVPAGV